MRKNNIKGFTLVELSIVIVVVGILAGIAFSNYNIIQKDLGYNNNVNRILGMIRDARGYASSSENVDVTGKEVFCADPYPLSYAIKFEKKATSTPATVYFYIDLCAPFDVYSTNMTDPLKTNGILIMDTFNLSSDLTFSFQNPIGGLDINTSKTSVLQFTPPYADLNIQVGAASDVSQVDYVITSSDNTVPDNKKIFLNKVSGIPQLLETS